MDFPFHESFTEYLTNDRFLAESTIKDLTADIQRLFNYLRQHSSSYQKNPALNQITDLDLKEYLGWLQIQKNIKNSTYNRILTHLNSYFEFLFQTGRSSSLPTIGLKGIKKRTSKALQTNIINWVDDLQSYLNNDNLSYYTRMMLLLTAHFFTATEFIQPEFYKVIPTINWNTFEQDFLVKFEKQHQINTKLQQCQSIFLKERVDISNPTISLSGLHKILKKDQPKISLTLKPSILYQQAVLKYIQDNQELTDYQLMKDIRLSRESLNYYRGLI